MLVLFTSLPSDEMISGVSSMFNAQERRKRKKKKRVIIHKFKKANAPRKLEKVRITDTNLHE